MVQENRVIVLIDMDCFYCQVEEKLNPELKDKPIAVVQYNPWKGGGIIAVNYTARAMGVTRHMRGDEAKKICPEIYLPSVPCSRGKADISKYREAGKEVARILQKFTPLLERASIDEAYLDITAQVAEKIKSFDVNSVSPDLTPNTYALGYDSIDEFIADAQAYTHDSIDYDSENAVQLLIGAVIVSEVRAAVFNETGYRCSAGIAHNKILAKLICGMNKPNKQTVLPKHSLNILYKTLSLKKVKHLGGKFGNNVCETLKISKMSELQEFTEKELQLKFDEKNGSWLYNIARGIDIEPVQARFNPKSIGCCKQFRGKNALNHLEGVKKWLKDLGSEIEDRLEKDALENSRIPKQMVVSFSSQIPDGKDVSSSRSYSFINDDEICGDFFSTKALELIMENISVLEGGNLRAPLTFLGISVGKFEDLVDTKKVRKIVDYFDPRPSKDISSNSETNSTRKHSEDIEKSKKQTGKEFIFKKFFQISEVDKGCETEISDANDKIKKHMTDNKSKLQLPLDKQESFFQKFLNNKTACKAAENISNGDTDTESTKTNCSVGPRLECENDSSDSNYSGSTINMEINKSIVLFEDDPEDVSRVSNMRNLLKPAVKLETEQENLSNDEIESNINLNNQPIEPDEDVVTVYCEECKININIEEFETHSDYHLAMKLKEKNVDKKVGKSKNVNIGSIKNFFMKIDETVPMKFCSECGKRFSVNTFSEHLDFHEAQKLNRELNKKKFTSDLTSNTVKRKRKNISPVKQAKIPCRAIDSFFR